MGWANVEGLRFDILLAQLLLGMTTLTVSVALAQSCADLLLAGRNVNPPARAGLRVAIAVILISACLLLFSSVQPGGPKSSGWWRAPTLVSNPVFLPPAEPLFESRAAIDAGAGRRLAHTTTIHEAMPEQVDTPAWSAKGMSVGTVGFETVELGDSKRSPNAMSGVSGLCAAWQAEVAALVGSVVPLLHPTKVDAVLVCASANLSTEDAAIVRAEIREHVGVMFVDAVGEKPADVLSESIGVAAFFPAVEGSRLVRLGGQRLAEGGLPQGLSVDLGDQWRKQAGVLAATSGEAAVGDGTALIFRDAGTTAPVAWTSLPPRLYDRLYLLAGNHWPHLVERVLAHALKTPIAAAATSLEEGERQGLDVASVASPLKKLAAEALGNGAWFAHPPETFYASFGLKTLRGEEHAEVVADDGSAEINAVYGAIAGTAPAVISARAWNRMEPFALAATATSSLLAQYAADDSSDQALSRTLIVPAIARTPLAIKGIEAPNTERQNVRLWQVETEGDLRAMLGRHLSTPSELAAMISWNSARRWLQVNVTAEKRDNAKLTLVNTGTAALERYAIVVGGMPGWKMTATESMRAAQDVGGDSGRLKLIGESLASGGKVEVELVRDGGGQ